MGVAREITKKSVLDAMAQVGADPRKWPNHSQSTGYDVLHPKTGARFPPKLILSVASRIATGRDLSRRAFGGGIETNLCLERLGFSIVPKRWIGPFQFRQLLERCLEEWPPKPPDSKSGYIVTKGSWTDHPTVESVPLYVGGTTGQSPRFRTRVGDLIADAFGFFTKETGHHSGGQSIHKWCLKNRMSPSELYIAWVDGSDCHRCLEIRMYKAFRPLLNQSVPTRCAKHR